MISQNELYSGLDAQKAQAILEGCYLENKLEYTDDERHLFNECKGLIEQGDSAQELQKHFSYREPTTQAPNKPKKSSKSKGRSLFELTSDVSELIGKKVSLSDVLKIVATLKLEEKESYTQDESDRVLAFLTIKTQTSDLNTSILNLSAASTEGLAKLIDSVTDRLTESVPDLFNRVYVQKIAANMAQSKQQIADFYVQLEEEIIAELDGKKSPLEMLIEPRNPLSLPMKSAQLLPESESDTITS
jgi:hypothetical protein